MNIKTVVFSGKTFSDCYGSYFKGFYLKRKVKIKKIYLNREYGILTDLGFISKDSIINNPN